MSSKKQHSSIFDLRGVGKETAKYLARLDIYSVQDLLFHLPSRYQDRTRIENIRQLTEGKESVIEGVIHRAAYPKRGRTKLLCELKDETGIIYLRFFHVLSFQTQVLRQGSRLRCYGTVRLGQHGLEMFHPEFHLIREGVPAPAELFLTPVYPATEGLSQYMLRKLMLNALSWMKTENSFEELLPAELLEKLAVPSLKEALEFVHRPPQSTDMSLLLERKTLSQKRLILEELLAHRISLLQIKKEFQSQKGVSLPSFKRVDEFINQLPFILTGAQTRVAQDIQKDLALSSPMLRLVQGDVGSGKTVIAALAMLQAIESGHQAALMAPTELLAEQHYRVFKRWFTPLNINVEFLSGHVKAEARQITLDRIKSGLAQIILGTHALFQDAVEFSALALVIVDEQHRFGVAERALFREKGMRAAPHQLVMTATPIPRTLAMSFYADLDCSVIDELPAGRKPIITSVVASTRRDEVIERIRKACQQGRQVYWVCPLIDESEVIACQAATQTARDLQTCLPEIRIELIHGRLSAEKKEAAMRKFQEGQASLLVATTVIEVGVDVPNASVMIIENAERLGLSQLHQLRGRVGRGTSASHCVLLYQTPLSDLAKKRLAVMRETTDGFKIAQRDLELRGPGEFLGTKQTGELAFKVADLLRDSDILPQVHRAGDIILRDFPHIISPLILRWVNKNKKMYGKV